MTWRQLKEHAREIFALVTVVMCMTFWLSYLYYQNLQNAADITALKHSVSGMAVQEAELRQFKDWKSEHGQGMAELQKALTDLQTTLVEQRTLLKTVQDTMQEIRQDVRLLMQQYWKKGMWQPQAMPWELRWLDEIPRRDEGTYFPDA